VQDALDTAIEAVMTGQSNPAAAMQTAQQRADQILAQYKK
jgi:ABC-type glycerol-3-phosphate transport system substrate-binding protein